MAYAMASLRRMCVTPLLVRLGRQLTLAGSADRREARRHPHGALQRYV